MKEKEDMTYVNVKGGFYDDVYFGGNFVYVIPF